MLINDLFVVEDLQPGDGMQSGDGIQSGDGTLTARVHLRFPHPIFDGHFPGRPVLPGACLVQLVEELVASVAGAEMRLFRAGPVKFIAMVDPLRDGSIVMKLQFTTDGLITAEGINAGATCFRFKGFFRGV
jgi:3-hydroxyacyl-[acyl-carrier-protein] dehydratase